LIVDHRHPRRWSAFTPETVAREITSRIGIRDSIHIGPDEAGFLRKRWLRQSLSTRRNRAQLRNADRKAQRSILAAWYDFAAPRINAIWNDGISFVRKSAISFLMIVQVLTA
jgi:hypothetical protein